MDNEKDLFKRVRKIEIKARGLSQQMFSGEYHSAFRGRGMAFSEVREYQYGDDVRNIDWNVTARLNHPYVKIFEEERELTVMLLIDVSGSNNFGTHVSLKKDMIAELAAVLAFSAIQNNDKVGVIFFSNKIEKFIPPKKGSTHILRIIRELITFEPENTDTDIAQALKYFTNVIKKRSTTFIISDFYDRNFDEPLKIAAKKHDLVALRIADRNEQSLPQMGLVNFFDQESQKRICIDTSDESVRKAFAKAYAEHEEQLQNIFTKYGIDNTLILTDDDYVKPLMKLFKMRGHKM
ncbi:MAG: DUF58 domain-containing protein [Bacteroidales bacterium]|jgi:uncharacterized protein (DUF58 family)|nr:DUF58 domain-containing protein [Bacteroidales bacterium]MBP5757798.1 DUF58 domain-containing protein [Bacteroidales bacterium]